MQRDCAECKNFEECYIRPTVFSERAMGLYATLIELLKSVRRRDLCVNNDKMNWKQKN